MASASLTLQQPPSLAAATLKVPTMPTASGSRIHDDIGIKCTPMSYPTRSPLPAPTPPLPDHQKSVFVCLMDHDQYSLSRPEFPLQVLQEVFGNLYARYDFALQVRAKVDEKLNEFKSVLGVHSDMSMPLCFQKWKELIANPTFTITFTKTSRKDVKIIAVRANSIPRNLWPAQKYIREVLEACHLFLEQYEFLQQVINEWIKDVDRLLGTLPDVMNEAGNLMQIDRQYIRELVPRMRTEYLQTIDWVQAFHDQIITLLDEIQMATPCLA